MHIQRTPREGISAKAGISLTVRLVLLHVYFALPMPAIKQLGKRPLKIKWSREGVI